jgi:transposase
MKAYSYDLRQRVIRAVNQGRPRAEIVAMFAISLATRKRYLKRQRETSDVRAKPIPGRPPKKGAALQARLPAQLVLYPDATLAEHCQIWETTQGMTVSSATMSRVIQRLNWTRKKKTLRASEQKEEDRAAWREQAQRLPAEKLVFIDECGSNIALTRLYARSPKGKRVYGAVPRNRRANITLLASLSLQGMGEAFILEGSADSTIFELYIEQILAPSLQAGQIIILDNLNTHTGEKVRQASRAHGDASSCFSHPTLPTCRRLRKRSRNSRHFYAAWEHALQKHCKRPLRKPSPLSLLAMLTAGLLIVGIV